MITIKTLMLLDDTVRDETPTETATYADIAKLTGTEPSKISSRWREPSLTIHNMTVSGSNSEFRVPENPRHSQLCATATAMFRSHCHPSNGQGSNLHAHRA